MPERTIDLRKLKSSEKTAGEYQTKSRVQKLAWSAYEYENKERGPYWFLLPGIVALLLIILGVFAQSYFFIAFVALAFTVLIMYSRRAPQMIAFAATQEGVRIGSKFYKFSDLKSFWVFNTPEVKELSLETEKTITPFIRLPLGDPSAEEIKNFLRDFLPEEEHKDFASDQIARSKGL